MAKNYEVDASYRKYKGRVVYLGKAVVDQFIDEATFRVMGSLLATLEVVKAAECYCCLPGHAIEIADGEQAHVQVNMKGSPILGFVFHRVRGLTGGRRASCT